MDAEAPLLPTEASTLTNVSVFIDTINTTAEKITTTHTAIAVSMGILNQIPMPQKFCPNMAD